MKFRAKDWFVDNADITQSKELIRKYHYARGGSHTGVFFHGLFDRRFGDDWLLGVAQWLPPTRVAAESVNKGEWQRVLALSRLVIDPGVPKNACSFLISKSIRLIERTGNWSTIVTYADESQGHLGTIYLAANFQYVGRMPATPRWVDPTTGRQVATLSTKTRTKQQMIDLGYELQGRFCKHKFVKHLRRLPAPGFF